MSTQLPDDMVVDVDKMTILQRQQQQQQQQRDQEVANEMARWRQKTETMLEQLSCKLELVYSKLQEPTQPPPPPPPPQIVEIPPPAGPSEAEKAFQSELKLNLGRIEQELQKNRRETKRLKKTVSEAQQAAQNQPVMMLPPPPPPPPPSHQTQVDIGAIVDTIQAKKRRKQGESNTLLLLGRMRSKTLWDDRSESFRSI